MRLFAMQFIWGLKIPLPNTKNSCLSPIGKLLKFFTKLHMPIEKFAPMSQKSVHNPLYQIAITQVPTVGSITAKQLISYCGGPEEVFKQSKQKLLRIPGIGEKTASEIVAFDGFKRIEQELKFIEKHGVKQLFYLDDEYPQRLKHQVDSPCLLYALGNADLNNTKVIAIVGTRNATDYGKQFIDQLIEALAPTGCLVVSGLAYGIDIQAHRAALRNDLPTVGVLAHGLDRLYPSQHSATAKRMVEKGGLLTEYISETNPDRENFPTRNRIVAGMCDALVVAETAVRGGAMITAQLAFDYNKEVLALPGRIDDTYSAGCNKLVKENKAAIITHPDDVLTWLNWQVATTSKPQKAQSTLPLNLSSEELSVISLLRQHGKTGIDDIVFKLQMDQGTLSLMLLGLEMQGLIKALPGKNYEAA
jgi:DNA processing protein